MHVPFQFDELFHVLEFSMLVILLFLLLLALTLKYILLMNKIKGVTEPQPPISGLQESFPMWNESRASIKRVLYIYTDKKH